MIANGPGKHERKSGGPVLQFLPHRGVGKRRIGQIDADQDLPRRAAVVRGDRLRGGQARRQGIDPQPIVSRAAEPFEWRTFEHAVNELPPSVARRGRKIRGKRQRFLRLGHRTKMP